MIQDWLFDALLTWWPLATSWLAVFFASNLCNKKLGGNGFLYWLTYYFSSKKILAVALVSFFIASALSPTNRPKNDITPNMSHQQSAYKSAVDQSASKEVIKIKKIESDFDENKQKAKELFEY